MELRGWNGTLLAVVIGIAAAGTLLWIAEPGVQTSPCGSSSSGNTPLGTTLAIGPPNEQTVGPGRWYNFSIQSAGGGMTIGYLGGFQIQTSTGAVVSPGPGWNLTMRNYLGNPVGTFELTGAAAGNWTTGGDLRLSSGQTIALFVTPQNLSGDVLIIHATGYGSTACPSYAQGSLTVSIP